MVVTGEITGEKCKLLFSAHFQPESTRLAPEYSVGGSGSSNGTSVSSNDEDDAATVNSLMESARDDDNDGDTGKVGSDRHAAAATGEGESEGSRRRPLGIHILVDGEELEGEQEPKKGSGKTAYYGDAGRGTLVHLSNMLWHGRCADGPVH